MNKIDHTIAELLEIPMEDWPAWFERQDVPPSEVRAIAYRLIGDELGLGPMGCSDGSSGTTAADASPMTRTDEASTARQGRPDLAF